MGIKNIFENKRSLYRFMGITASVSALLISVADFLLEFNKEYGISTEIVEAEWINTPNWRFLSSMYLCEFLIPFYILGFWLLYKVISKNNKKLAIVLFSLFSYGVIMGSPLVHGMMCLNAIIYKFGIGNGLSHELLKQLIEGQITNSVMPVFLVHYIITWFIASTILFLHIIRGKSILKRWTAFLNPLVFMIIWLLGLILVPKLFVYITPGAINKGNAVLFLLLTIKMWNYGEVEKINTDIK